MTRHAQFTAGIVMLGALFACASIPGPSESCQGFPDWQSSWYSLPYPVGARYLVDQANCSGLGDGHRGMGRCACDFLMPIGTVFTVARAGTVVHVEASHLDGQVAVTGFDNYIVVAHDDGIVDRYGHLTHDGADVLAGQRVAKGDVLGRSGNTGNTANKPHLHLAAHSCDLVSRGSAACPTLPVTFNNTDANPTGLIRGDRMWLVRKMAFARRMP